MLTVGLQTLDLLVSPVADGVLSRELTTLDTAQLMLGGDALNQAVVLSQLGARVALMSAVGRDRLGQVLLDQLKQYPLTALEHPVDAPTCISVVLVDEQHERHFLFQPGQNNRLAYEHLDESAVADASIVSVGGVMALPALDGEGTVRLLSLARRSGARTAMDLRIGDEHSDRDALREAIRLTDFLLPSEKEATWLTGETEPAAMAAALREMGAANCVIKLGGDGCYLSAGGVETHIPSFPCRCIDTTGAGDTFVGAFLYGVSRGWDLPACARFANAAGSIAVEHPGANQAITSLQQVLDRVEGRG